MYRPRSKSLGIGTIVLLLIGTIVPTRRTVNREHEDVASAISKPLTLEKAVGRVFTELRESKGLKQIDVATATGYVLRTVGMVERGEKSPTLRTMDNFATFYEIPLETVIKRAKKLRQDFLKT